MATILSKLTYDNYTILEEVKGNTPFVLYDNDPEFARDAKNVTLFVAQRMGVASALARVNLNITELTVYAAFEEAVTTYGNEVYQYKVRENYLGLEGTPTLPFKNNLVNMQVSTDVGSEVNWSATASIEWADINYAAAYSASVSQGEIVMISASLGDFVSPNLRTLKSWSFPSSYPTSSDGVSINYDLSTPLLSQFNTIGDRIERKNLSVSFTSASVASSSFSDDVKVISIPVSSFDSKATSLNASYFTYTSSAITAEDNYKSLSGISGSTLLLYVSASTAEISNPVNQTGNLTYRRTGLDQFIYFFLDKAAASNLLVNRFTGDKTGQYPTIYTQDVVESALNTRLTNNNISSVVRLAEDYASQAGVGGFTQDYQGMVKMKAGQQLYDLNAWAVASASLSPSDRIEVTRVFYQEPPAIVRYFDPYAGTGTGVQGLLETFGFGSYSPGVNFLMMPVYWDIQKIQAIEFNDQVRKSAFSFELINNQLRIFPVPTYDAMLKINYKKRSETSQAYYDNQGRDMVVTDVTNVPYLNPIYSNINPIGRTWIFKYTLALCKEIEGHIRVSFSTTNIPTVGAPVGTELLTDARAEKEALIVQLRDTLDQTSRRAQLERKQQESQFTKDTFNNIPLPIYIG